MEARKILGPPLPIFCMDIWLASQMDPNNNICEYAVAKIFEIPATGSLLLLNSEMVLVGTDAGTSWFPALDSLCPLFDGYFG
jgi:hypothetical protein